MCLDIQHISSSHLLQRSCRSILSHINRFLKVWYTHFRVYSSILKGLHISFSGYHFVSYFVSFKNNTNNTIILLTDSLMGQSMKDFDLPLSISKLVFLNEEVTYIRLAVICHMLIYDQPLSSRMYECYMCYGCLRHKWVFMNFFLTVILEHKK